ncbi:hypothetical protein RchiOBHm_Chr4g0417561 [Rosa chinensis]|uniref:Uncharacterized protein n=1 Tax=Rosa chinensis TaxID=74649 RepID=A0A2P6QX83_ROSCH|nr:hypothetical protein RchiOBHm_Chr4g0417561 [Rosa chinensis]
MWKFLIAWRTLAVPLYILPFSQRQGVLFPYNLHFRKKSENLLSIAVSFSIL